MRWPKCWSSSFIISPSNEYSGLISFRIDWCDLLAVQRALRSLLQHHNLKVSVLPHPAFLMVQLSHPYVTTGEKTTALTIWTFVSKVMPLHFKVVSRFLHSYSSKEQESFNFMAAVIIHIDFGAQENEIWHCFHIFPIYLPWSDRTRCHDLRILIKK